MFSKDITGSDAFLEMPASSQALYFHLGMEADDDGFIGNPKKVMRVLGVNDDDLKILLSKRFLLLFKSGVIVVKHHRINNKWDKYNCRRTVYMDEFSQLNIKENRAYTLDKTQGIPVLSDNSLTTVLRIEENRIDKNRINTSVAVAPQVEVVPETEEIRNPRAPKKFPHSKEVFSWFPTPEPSWTINTTELKHAELLWARGEAKVKGALTFIKKHRGEDFLPKVTKPSDLERKWNDLAEYKV